MSGNESKCVDSELELIKGDSDCIVTLDHWSCAWLSSDSGLEHVGLHSGTLCPSMEPVRHSYCSVPRHCSSTEPFRI